jgi:serine phosphatase RsbU (regulator of sigma subunit)
MIQRVPNDENREDDGKGPWRRPGACGSRACTISNGSPDTNGTISVGLGFHRVASSLNLLIERLDACAPFEIPSIAASWLNDSGILDEVGIWIADVSGTVVEDLGGDGGVVEVEDSPFEVPLHEYTPVFADREVWLPLHHRGLVIGVLSGSSSHPDESTLRAVSVVLGSALVASRAQSDYVSLARGEAQMSLPATIQRDLLPNPSYLGKGIEIAGGVEPAYEVAGDVFDYSIAENHVDFAIFDAVGHGLRSAIIASATVGAYRRLRRSELPLKEIADGIEEELKKVLGSGEFVAGIIGRLQAGGRLEIWNAGHIPPLLVGGDGTVELRNDDASPPFGLGAAGEPGEVALSPGDTLILTTDGIIEARSQIRESFGQSRLNELINAYRETPATRLTREILDAVTSHVHDPLADDATVLVIRLGQTPDGAPESG